MRRFLLYTLISILSILIIVIIFIQVITQPTPIKDLLPLPKVIENYQPPQISEKDAYTILFTGDSMTKALGENSRVLREYLSTEFPDKTFGLFNYAEGSTSILSLPSTLDNQTTVDDRSLPPILDRHFEVIIIGTHAHNPLSQYPLQEGLQIQEEILDKVVYRLANHKPKPLIVFLATLAPSKTHYAQNSVDLSEAQRAQWASERIAYLENFISYANNHHIPLINVYQKSFDQEGKVNLEYINSDDGIHPSQKGVELISQQIAIFLAQVLPH